MKKYSPIKLTIIILISFILFGVFAYLYQEKNYTEKWLICEYPNKYSNYTEILKFRFTDELYGYYREEELSVSIEKDIEEQYKYFIDIKEGLELSDTFTYDVKKEKNKVIVKTYIEVHNQEKFFDHYMENMNIKSNDSIDLVELELKKLGYTCKIIKK